MARLRLEEWVLLAIALLWSAGLFLFASLVTVYQGTSEGWSESSGTVVTAESWTLVEENGSGILWAIAVPALVTIVVGIALWFRGARRGAGAVAWGFTGLLALANLAAMLSIGILVIPVTGCLVVACILREVIAPAQLVAPRP